MVQPLPGFLNLSLNVCSPCQVLGDVYIEVFEATHPVLMGPTDHKRSVGPLLSLPEVHDQLFGFETVPYQSVTLDVTSEDRRIGISLRETNPLRV